MARKASIDLILFLQICVSIFLIVIGVQGLVGGSESDSLVKVINDILPIGFGVINIIISVLEILCGAIILAVIFAPVGTTFVNIIVLIAFILWALIVIFKDIIGAFDAFRSASTFLNWLKMFVTDSLILLSIWIVKSRK